MYIVKCQRFELNWYYMISVVTYFFTIIQMLSMTIVFSANFESNKLQLAKTLFMLIICLISVIYLQKKILQLLHLKEDELRYRSHNLDGSIIYTDNNEDDH
jgi:hypothetical protein